MTRITNDINVCVRASYVWTDFGSICPVGPCRARWATHAAGGVGFNNQIDIVRSSTGSYEYIIEPTARIAIDLNIRVRGNGTYAGFEDVTGPIAVGDQVEVFETESSLVGRGRVTEIDGERELVYLSVDWSSLTDDSVLERVKSSSTTGQALFLSSESTTVASDRPAWMTLVVSPSLAYITATDVGVSVTAPAEGWTNNSTVTLSVSCGRQAYEYRSRSDQMAVMA